MRPVPSKGMKSGSRFAHPGNSCKEKREPGGSLSMSRTSGLKLHLKQLNPHLFDSFNAAHDLSGQVALEC